MWEEKEEELKDESQKEDRNKEKLKTDTKLRKVIPHYTTVLCNTWKLLA